MMPVPLRKDETLMPALDPRVWKGKKILVDLDGTMVQCRELKDMAGYLAANGTDAHVIREGFPALPYYSVERVNEEAAAVLKSLGHAGAMPVITSGGGGAYVAEVLEKAGIIDSFYSYYAYEELAYLIDDAWRIMPKNYAPVISDLGIQDPEANCVIIGNEPRIDIPVFPQGVLTVLTTMDFSFSEIVNGLARILNEGGGDFGRGFDSLHGKGIRPGEKMDLVLAEDWDFRPDCHGKARIMYCDYDEVIRAGTQPIYS